MRQYKRAALTFFQSSGFILLLLSFVPITPSQAFTSLTANPLPPNEPAVIVLNDLPLNIVVNAGPDLYQGGSVIDPTQIQNLDTTLSSHLQNLQGVTLYLSWSRFQEKQNINGSSPSDFSAIDDVLPLVSKYDKKLNIGLLPGCWSPSWLQPLLQFPLFHWSTEPGGCSGSPVSWDLDYLDQFKSAVQSLAAHLKTSPYLSSIGYINVTGPSLTNGLEMNIPLNRPDYCQLGANTPGAPSTFSATCTAALETGNSCYTACYKTVQNAVTQQSCMDSCEPLPQAKQLVDSAFVAAWKRMVDIYSNAFSDKAFQNVQFAIALHTTDGPFTDRSSSDLVSSYAYKTFGQRFVPMALYLDHRNWFNQNATQVQVVTDWVGKTSNLGFQTLYDPYYNNTAVPNIKSESQRARCLKLAVTKAKAFGATFAEVFWVDYTRYHYYFPTDMLSCPTL
jgi:hypothetical protein